MAKKYHLSSRLKILGSDVMARTQIIDGRTYGRMDRKKTKCPSSMEGLNSSILPVHALNSKIRKS